MNSALNFLAAVPVAIWIALAVLIGLMLLYALSNQTKFYWMLFRYDFPLVGKLVRLAREDQRAGGSKWYLSEQELCAEFHRFHPGPATREEYDRATSYLGKAQELGRRDMPWFGWVVVFVLLTAEALSFGILLAGYIAQNASLRQQTWLGYLAATVLAIILLALTHTAGRQLHNNSLIGKAREWFRGRPASEQAKALRPYPGVSLQKNTLDDAEPIYVQVAGRIVDHSSGKFRPAYVWPLIALIVVIGFGALSFYIRTELFDQLQIQETLGSEERAPNFQPGASQDINARLANSTEAARKRGQDEGKGAAARAALAAFGALALLFLAMQVIGVSVGYFFGFCGRESAAAAAIRGRYKTAEEYLDFKQAYRDYVARHAQARLTRLQRRMRAVTNDANFDQDASDRSFRAYAIEQIQARARERDSEVTARAAVTHSEATQTAQIEVRTAADSDGSEAALRRRIEAEVAQKLRQEKLETSLRVEIERRQRAELGLDKTR